MSASDISAVESAVPPETGLAIATGPTWQEQDVALRELWLRNQPPDAIAQALGRSIAAIMTRAARLGLPRRSAPGRKPGRRLTDTSGAHAAMRAPPPVAAKATPDSAQTSLRVCLMCLNKFESMGRHNRICSSCKSSSEYESASALPDIHLPTS